MSTKVAKSTQRGQVTLPKKWRSNFQTNCFTMEMHEDKLIIKPLNIESARDEEVLFDAARDNDGKGVSPDDIITALQEIKNG